MNDNSYDIRLIAQHYDVHPQGIVWMRPIFEKDNKNIADFEFTYCNDEGLNYLNLDRETFEGLLISNSPTLSDQLRKDIFQEMVTVYNTGTKNETTVFNSVLNKHAKILRFKLHGGVLTVVQDITKERHIIEQLENQAKQLDEQKKLLQEQKTLLDNIMANTSNGISVSEIFRDENGKVVDALTILANDAAVKYIGLPRDVYLSKRATELEPAIIGSPYYQACIKTLETGEPFVMQYQMQSTRNWLELTVSKLDYKHLIQVFTDVTTIKEAQVQLEKFAGTLKTVFDSAQTGMFTFIPEYNDEKEIVDFRFVLVNSTVSTFLGEIPEKLEGELASTRFPGYLTNGVFKMYKNTFETGVPLRKEIHYRINNDVHYIDLQSVKMDGQLLVTLINQTTLRKSQLQLQQTVKALQRSNTYLNDFAYAASHDLKEPIRKVRTFMGRLRGAMMTRMTETELGLFERIDKAANRMQLLIDDLLQFSSVSENVGQLEPVDLDKKIQNVLSDLELSIEEKQAQIVIKNPLPVIHGNKLQLQQLFQNIISNALKYGKLNVPSVVTIDATIVSGDDMAPKGFALPAEKEYHLITISDNGIGFEQQFAEQIFELFKRLHGKSEYSGTGIGLSIVRKVVENHNGHIWAEGVLDKGSTFYILLPAQ